MPQDRAPTRIQRKNRTAILEAALSVFSAHGFRGATVDQIAKAAGLSKPNLLYYFPSKEAMHNALLEQLLDTWLDPLRDLDAEGDPIEEVMTYVNRKLRDSPCFAVLGLMLKVRASNCKRGAKANVVNAFQRICQSRLQNTFSRFCCKKCMFCTFLGKVPKTLQINEGFLRFLAFWGETIVICCYCCIA